MSENLSETGLPSARDLLLLDEVGPDRFCARRNLDNYAGATFGGQALGQALAAAQRTAPAWPANSLSGYFLRAGAIDAPVEFAVERVNDGRRFAVRRVLARQAGRPIFDMLCSFHDPEPGPQHQFARTGNAPSPEDLPDLQAFAAANAHRLPPPVAALFTRTFPIELRLLDPERYFDDPGAPVRDFWFRMPSASELTCAQDHQALLAVMSDYWLPSPIGAPHRSDGMQWSVASLNHALWFHQPVRTDDWLLYRTDSHWADCGRGLARGLIFDRQGQLLATATQEALLRPRKGAEAKA